MVSQFRYGLILKPERGGQWIRYFQYSETQEMLDYLRLHKVRFSPNLRKVIKAELSGICKDFKMKQKRIKNAPDWLFE